MLLEFQFKNIYSYRNKGYFSMEAVKGTKKKNEFSKYNSHRILKSAILFGPNASGKSNLLKSLRVFRRLVIKDDTQENPFPSYGMKLTPIELQVVILENKMVYRYSVKYLPDEIVDEKLEIEENGEFLIYFHRTKLSYTSGNKELLELTSRARKDNLFLGVGKAFNDDHCLNVYRWFRNNLIFISKDISPLLKQLHRLQRKKNFKKRFLNFLQAADINISNFEVVESISKIESELSFLLDKRSEFKHYDMLLRHEFSGDFVDDKYFTLKLGDESDGTQKLIALAIIILSFEGKTILIDEFDDSLHLELSKSLIDLFNCEENQNQFILTSHELALMDCDFKKEQIYLTDRENSGESDLFSIYDFRSEENRRDYSYLKRYKNGMFGAVPDVLKMKLRQALKE
ncbi:ATP-binding protein [Streptococcus sp. NLN64]|uniref:AAA family ATPase n=1 Tax=Streptococcus sp. NLN64 TaxID=2822799 RepID=UPI0018C953B0|nr:ATP-binding protein [Streptococcus sp. NLN64]MBG9368114.1 ATP-binding protein [Streptococcus sp. NLN64]